MSMYSDKYQVLGAYRFMVEIEGLQVAGFTEVGGLNIKTEMFEYQEGGLNSYVHQFPVATKFDPLVFKRGISDYYHISVLWDWYKDCTDGQITKKDGSIIMNNQQGIEVCRWYFLKAQPISWRGPEFHSLGNEVAIETIELVHEGLKLMIPNK